MSASSWFGLAGFGIVFFLFWMFAEGMTVPGLRSNWGCVLGIALLLLIIVSLIAGVVSLVLHT